MRHNGCMYTVTFLIQPIYICINTCRGDNLTPRTERSQTFDGGVCSYFHPYSVFFFLLYLQFVHSLLPATDLVYEKGSTNYEYFLFLWCSEDVLHVDVVHVDILYVDRDVEHVTS